MSTETLTINWLGPFSWPGYGTTELPEAPDQPGVYLQTYPYRQGFLIHCAGLTRRSVRKRHREHTRRYLSGDYTVLVPDAIQNGKREEVWHGWGWTDDKRAEFDRRKEEIVEAAEEQLNACHIFLAPVGTEPRLLERLEAGIMAALYEGPSPICDLPDRGMQLAARWEKEDAVQTNNVVPAPLYGLPDNMTI